MKKVFSLIILTFLTSCKHESKFDLERYLYQFSEKIENNDTIEVLINHAGCTSRLQERHTFIKQNDSVFLSTQTLFDSHENDNKKLKTLYTIKEKDSSSFENYFKYLKKNDKKDESSSSIISVNYKNKRQTYSFYASDLRDKFEKLERYMLIREKIYPEDKSFESEETIPSTQ